MDFWGYIENKGWVYCFVYVFDVFIEIVYNMYIIFEWYEELIYCLLNKIFILFDFFYNNEDECIVILLLVMLYYDFFQNDLIFIIYKKIKRFF